MSTGNASLIIGINATFITNTTFPVNHNAVTSWFIVSTATCTLGAGMAAIMLAAIPTHRHLRTGSGVLVNNLLLAQLANCILLPSTFVLTFEVSRGTLSKTVNCDVWLSVLPQFVEPWASAFLAINRFVALMYPHRYKPWTSKCALFLMVMGSWTGGYLLNAIYYLHFKGRIDLVLPEGFCTTRAGRADAPFLTLFAGFTSLIPYGLVAASTFLIFLKLLYERFETRTAPISVELPTVSMVSPRRQRRFRAVQILFASSLVHCLCFIPYGLFVTQFRSAIARYTLLFYWTRTLYVAGFAVDPFVIFMLSKDFQQGVKSLLWHCGLSRPVSVSPETAARSVRSPGSDPNSEPHETTNGRPQ